MSSESPPRRGSTSSSGTSRPQPSNQSLSDSASAAEAPMLQWLLEMLICMNPHEAMEVVLRPGGDRRRECKIHVPAGERGLLEIVLDGLKMPGPGESDDVGLHKSDSTSDDATIRPETSDQSGQSETTTNLYTLEVEILRVISDAGRPLAGKVVAARLGRKYSGWVKACLARLVKIGLLNQGSEGYEGRNRGAAKSDDGR